MKERIFLSLGSNIGDRRANLTEALSLLEKGLGAAPEGVSDFIETESWGFDAPDFINAVASFMVENPDPFRVLAVCKDVECVMGREEKIEFDSDGNRIYHSRVIDIDILTIGERTVDSDNLRIPHPLMYKRDFVMVPLRQLSRRLNIKL